MFSPSQLRHTRKGGYPYHQTHLEMIKLTGFPIALGMTGVTTPLEKP